VSEIRENFGKPRPEKRLSPGREAAVFLEREEGL
jgi:hypothetical protein